MSVEAQTTGRPAVDPVVAVEGLCVEFKVSGQRQPLRAVDGVSFDVRRREIFGLIGESGSGKSTVARAVMRLTPIAAGSVRVGGLNFENLRGRGLRRQRRRIQMVFQDPHEALDPRMSVRAAIREPLVLSGLTRAEADARVLELIHLVGLEESHLERKPHALSGGQKQRVNIARALSLEPEFLICDEAVSALDVSVQAGIINLLLRLQQELGLAILFISHDLSVVAHLSDRVGVMYRGRLVEVARTDDLAARPLHPYTEMLWASEPTPMPSAASALDAGWDRAVAGAAPSLTGCRFRNRCPYAVDKCLEEPALEVVAERLVACHRVSDLSLAGRRG
ncbi:MAG: oligopeptide/dipeptide ABC transporter ATP-binding protein [Marmoricola sp.]